ncbi:MAG: hypothetical protein WCB85_10130 [Candidatus Dormiibacterota bacterium]
MTPPALTTFFTACAAVAGSLEGLLFVAISLRYDAILGPTAPSANRAVAAAAFTALTNALILSLWALVPGVNLGYPVVAVAIGSLWSTVRTHFTRSGRRDTSVRSFVVSLLIYLFELVVGAVLIARPTVTGLVYDLAYMEFGAFSAALARSWQLLQPEPAEADGSHDGPSPGAELPGLIATLVRLLARGVRRATSRLRRRRGAR